MSVNIALSKLSHVSCNLIHYIQYMKYVKWKARVVVSIHLSVLIILTIINNAHKGICNNNTADDCMIPGGTLVNDCAVMANYWPASVDGKNCTKPTAVPPVQNPPETCDPPNDCNLLKSKWVYSINATLHDCFPFN